MTAKHLELVDWRIEHLTPLQGSKKQLRAHIDKLIFSRHNSLFYSLIVLFFSNKCTPYYMYVEVGPLYFWTVKYKEKLNTT